MFGFRGLPTGASVFFVEMPKELDAFPIGDWRWQDQPMKVIHLPMFEKGSMILVSPEDWAQTLEKAAHIQTPQTPFRVEAEVMLDQLARREVTVGEQTMMEVKLPLFGESTLFMMKPSDLDRMIIRLQAPQQQSSTEPSADG